MNLDDLTLGQIKQLQNLFSTPTQLNSGIEDHGLKIVILDRGFVYVGTTSTDSQWCYIKNAKNIRVWGTSKGLGELAANGPLSNTKMDDCGDIQAPLKSVIHLMSVEVGKWPEC